MQQEVQGEPVVARGWSARAYALLSIVAAALTIGLLFGAYLLTNSVGLFSAAAESVTNLLAAGVAFWLLTVAARPPDEEHAFGHSKAEYFSSGVEGSLILVAAIGIAWSAWERLFHPQPIENIGPGMAVSVLAAVMNGAVALVLLRAGRRLRSITLNADAHHLFADVWTTAGVLVGVVLVQITGWLQIDSIVAFIVAANITWTGYRLLDSSAHGLLDTTLPESDQKVIEGVLEKHQEDGIAFHAVRSRVAGQRRFVEMHVLVPGTWSVSRGHRLCDQIEQEMARALPQSVTFTHLEPLEEQVSWDDLELDRLPSGSLSGKEL